MSYRKLLIIGLVVLVGLLLALLFEFQSLVATKREGIKTQREATETQRRIQFEQRSSEIKAEIEHRRTLLKEEYEIARKRIIDDGGKLAVLYGDVDKAAKQMGQWLMNLKSHYQSADADLIFDEVYGVEELRKQIWAK